MMHKLKYIRRYDLCQNLFDCRKHPDAIASLCSRSYSTARSSFHRNGLGLASFNQLDLQRVIAATEDDYRKYMKDTPTAAISDSSADKIGGAAVFEALAKRFNSAAFQHALSASLAAVDLESNFDRVVSLTTSQLLLRHVRRSADTQLLRFLQRSLSTEHCARMFNLQVGDFENLIESSLQQQNVSAAFQWMLIAAERFDSPPSRASCLNILTATMKAGAWDHFYFLLEELDQRGIHLSAACITSILDASKSLPVCRWRHVAKLLHSISHQRIADVDSSSSSSSSGKSRSPEQYLLAPATFMAAVEVLIEGMQYALVRKLYRSAVAAEADAGTLAHFPVHHNLLLTPFATAAIILRDFDFLKSILCGNIEWSQRRESQQRLKSLNQRDPNLSVSSGSNGSSSSGYLSDVIESPIDWLRSHVLHISGPHVAAAAVSGAQIGAVVAWILCAETEMNSSDLQLAEDLWQQFFKHMQNVDAASLSADSNQFGFALSDAMDAVSIIALRADRTRVLHSSAAFLRRALISDATRAATTNAAAADTSALAVLFPPSIVASTAAVVRSKLSSARMTRTVESMIEVFSRTRDSSTAAVLLSAILQKGIMISEHHLTSVLQLLQQEGDHNTVVDICELLLPRIGKSQLLSNPAAVVRQSKSSKRAATATQLAPHFFTTAAKSYAELASHERLAVILTEHLPNQGIIPRVQPFLVAIDSMRRSGEYSLGANLYFAAAAAFDRRKFTAGPRRGVDASAVAESALLCCRAGRLGRTALEIYAHKSEAVRLRRSQAVAPGTNARICELVLGSLANAEYAVVIPKFLTALAEEETKSTPLTNASVVTSALAAAAVAGDDATFAETVRLLEQTNRRPLWEIATTQRLREATSKLIIPGTEEAFEEAWQTVSARCQQRRHTALENTKKSD